ncbi:hypothetical protein FNU76_21445 [Chitinimonas arctica]|uniref:Uncharacterized protein n=1 Tax=Chitinimonas arctica TaxID=2594795 RepID=A0A516SKN1_9NEIS|nr:hypothetical protein [Chitinimonas arctica]QDQ28710.1 hypothetical protein FNU76_21445 [Chitinimonas arctica]
MGVLSYMAACSGVSFFSKDFDEFGKSMRREKLGGPVHVISRDSREQTAKYMVSRMADIQRSGGYLNIGKGRDYNIEYRENEKSFVASRDLIDTNAVERLAISFSEGVKKLFRKSDAAFISSELNRQVREIKGKGIETGSLDSDEAYSKVPAYKPVPVWSSNPMGTSSGLTEADLLVELPSELSVAELWGQKKSPVIVLAKDTDTAKRLLRKGAIRKKLASVGEGEVLVSENNHAIKIDYKAAEAERRVIKIMATLRDALIGKIDAGKKLQAQAMDLILRRNKKYDFKMTVLEGIAVHCEAAARYTDFVRWEYGYERHHIGTGIFQCIAANGASEATQTLSRSFEEILMSKKKMPLAR